ncbi:MAG: glycosyltransferase family 4 protein [Ignavibacteriaceae bacterium]|nr:glycosyltransferase family 4 protein [Ignavibacteriaceae bacterium]
MKDKRICIISKFLYENDTRLQQQAKTLASSGANVDVLCLTTSYKKTRNENGINIHGVAHPIPKETIVKYLLSTLQFGLACLIKLLRLSFVQKFDIIVVHTLPEFLVFVTFFEKLKGTKVLLDIRDTSVELFATKWGTNKRKFIMKLVKGSANLACHYSDKIITASPGFYNKLIEREIPREKIDVVFNSADTAIFKFDESRKFKKITSGAKLIYHGTISERFGVDIAISALKIVQSKIPDSQLTIYGFYDEDYKKFLQNQISKLELENYVYLNGKESLENIYKQILISDIGLVPYRSDDFMQLAFSTKMFEYVNSGIPVVASRLRPAESVFDDTCILYATPNDPQSFANNIIRFCLEPELRQSCANNAFKAHQKVSSDEMSKLYLNIIKNLLNS